MKKKAANNQLISTDKKANIQFGDEIDNVTMEYIKRISKLGGVKITTLMIWRLLKI